MIKNPYFVRLKCLLVFLNSSIVSDKIRVIFYEPVVPEVGGVEPVESLLVEEELVPPEVFVLGGVEVPLLVVDVESGAAVVESVGVAGDESAVVVVLSAVSVV